MMNNNSKKNNGEKGIELLPEELRRKEEKKKEEKKPPEITFYIPAEEKKPSEEKKSEKIKISLFEKIFGTKEEREKKRLARQKAKEEREKRKAEERARLEALQSQKEAIPKAEKVPVKEMKVKEVKPEKKKMKIYEPKKEVFLKPSLGITLIPEEEEAPVYFPPNKQLAIVFVFGLLALILSGVFYLAMNFYQSSIKNQIKDVSMNLESLNKEIANYEEEKVEAEKIQGKLEAIKYLLATHFYWTKFFDLLEKNTIPNVYYTNFVASSDGAVSLSAVGKNFSSVAEQLVSFEEAKNLVKEVNITSASAQVDPTGEITAANFEIELKLVPDALLK